MDAELWMATRNARIDRLRNEAEQAAQDGDNNTAIVLFTLIGSMNMLADDRLAGLCRVFASKGRDEAIEAKARLDSEAA